MEQRSTCKTCRFFEPANTDQIGAGHAGECRRNPPAVGTLNRWPYARPDDWCGEHQGQPVPKPDYPGHIPQS